MGVMGGDGDGGVSIRVWERDVIGGCWVLGRYILYFRYNYKDHRILQIK